jgi:hypothetical protein
MAARRWAVLALCVALLAAPLAPARAAGDDTSSRSRVGVLLMVMCGFAAKAAIPAPVPWAGVAVLSCVFGMLDAAMTEDSPSGSPASPAPGHP